MNTQKPTPEYLPNWMYSLPKDALVNAMELEEWLDVSPSTLNQRIDNGQFVKADHLRPRGNNKRPQRYWTVGLIRKWHQEHTAQKPFNFCVPSIN